MRQAVRGSAVPELTTDFQSLPEEYQHVIRLAQDNYKITVAPLQLLVGGWSGAVVYLVSISSNDTKRLEHCILKLDRKGKNAKSDEVTRHNTVMEKSTPQFARDHLPSWSLTASSMKAPSPSFIALRDNPYSNIFPYRSTN